MSIKKPLNKAVSEMPVAGLELSKASFQKTHKHAVFRTVKPFSRSEKGRIFPVSGSIFPKKLTKKLTKNGNKNAAISGG